MGRELFLNPFGDATAQGGGGCDLRGYRGDGFWVQYGGGGELDVSRDDVGLYVGVSYGVKCAVLFCSGRITFLLHLGLLLLVL